jgi:predicted HAD superfamily Cof-like phosphohydrolase
MNVFELQREFTKAGDVEHPCGESHLAASLVEEEYNEWDAEQAYAETKNIDDLKEAVDLLYVVAGYLNAAVGPKKATGLFMAVHENNMEKCIEGKLVKGEDGKILKPEGFNKEGWVKPFFKILVD